MRKESIGPFILGMVVGAIVLAVIGFNWGGWVTESTADEMAEEAVVGRLAEVCVARFKQDPQKGTKLKELKEASSWNRGDLVAKHGWATMLGQQEPNTEVAAECAEKIIQAS